MRGPSLSSGSDTCQFLDVKTKRSSADVGELNMFLAEPVTKYRRTTAFKMILLEKREEAAQETEHQMWRAKIPSDDMPSKADGQSFPWGGVISAYWPE